jgi:hypothetical protein
MNRKSRVAISTSALLFSLSFAWAIFTKVHPGQDLYAYALSLIALLFAALSAIVLYPLRDDVVMRLFCAITILVFIFWAVEFFGGISWYLLDKLARHYQKP